MKDSNISIIIKILKKECKNFNIPIVTEISLIKRDPFKVLISTVLSLRTKDETTSKASKRLFKLASTPKKLLTLSTTQIEKAIYPVGFYKTKAKRLKEICTILKNKHKSVVPDNIDTLLTLPGVGRKTANLVLTLGYNKLGLCVDTHVHRISNRFSYVKTKTPKQTEFALRKKLPKEYWIIYNDLLVAYGQNICRPISPFCSICKISKYCKKVGVKTKR